MRLSSGGDGQALDGSAEALDYQKDRAELLRGSVFEPARAPDTLLERGLLAAGFLAMAAVLGYLGVPFVQMAWLGFVGADGTQVLRVFQRVMLAGAGAVVWSGALWLVVLACRKLWPGMRSGL